MTRGTENNLSTLLSMRWWSLSFLLLPLAHATALTAILGSSEKSCYYADVDGVGEKIGKFIRERL